MNVWEKRLITAIKKACAANGAQTLYDGQRLCALIESADPELAQQREYKNFRALVRCGVDESRLYPEERSTSTQENLRYSRAILEELGVDPARRVAIVTSDFHLCRARLMWGGDTAAVPAHLPSTLYFQCLTVNYFIREAFGLAAYFVYGG